MTLAQALKEKNKKAAKLNKLWQKIYKHNSVSVDAVKPYDLEKIWEEILAETSELIRLKARIHQASALVREDIFALSELKSQLSRIEGINTDQGKVTDRYSGTTSEIVAHFGPLWKDQQISLLEESIEKIQERLDKFNHTTEI